MYGGDTNEQALVTYYRETNELDKVRGKNIMTVNPEVYTDIKKFIK